MEYGICFQQESMQQTPPQQMLYYVNINATAIPQEVPHRSRKFDDPRSLKYAYFHGIEPFPSHALTIMLPHF